MKNTASLDIGVGTNNPAGYSLSMTASDTSLTRTTSIVDGNNTATTPTISPLSTAGSAVGYSASEYESASSNAYTLNSWGYKKSTAANFMPMASGSISLTSTNVAANTNTTTLDFAAKVDSNKPSGTYRTTLSFTAIANVVPKSYTINYIDASGDGSGLPPSQTGMITKNTDIVLSSTVPTRSLYSFIGWCTTDNSSDPTTCSGTNYQQGASYPLIYDNNSVEVSLYAVWKIDGVSAGRKSPF